MKVEPHPPRTPRGRSPTARKSSHGLTRFTPNRTQVPLGSPPPGKPLLLDLPVPPFPPPSASAEECDLKGHESVELHCRRSDDCWLPSHRREGKAFAPRGGPAAGSVSRQERSSEALHATWLEPPSNAVHATRQKLEPADGARAARLESEVQVLRASLERLQQESKGNVASSSNDMHATPPRGFVGLHGHDLRGVVHGSGGGLHTVQGFDCVPPPNPAGVCQPCVSLHDDRPQSSELGVYGRWRGDDASAPAPLPWNEGAGNGKAELPELSSETSPLELGDWDWLAVCGPVLRDISQLSARWWNLTLLEAQCYYDRSKTASPLERVQIDPKLPDELLWMVTISELS